MSDRPRTTGRFSGSAHLHGHLSQLAKHFGLRRMEELKTYMKYDNVHWPWREVTIDSVPVYAAFSESDVDTKAESEAIEWCHTMAAEEGVRLVEISE